MNGDEIEKLMLLQASSIPSPSMGIVTAVEHCQWVQKNFLKSMALGREGWTGPRTETGLDSLTSPKHLSGPLRGVSALILICRINEYWFILQNMNIPILQNINIPIFIGIILSIITMKSVRVWCLKMTILHVCHACIKKNYWSPCVSHTEPPYSEFFSVKLGRKTARKEEVWRLLAIYILPRRDFHTEKYSGSLLMQLEINTLRRT